MFPQVAQEGLPTSIEFPQQFHLLYPSLRASAGRSAITASNSRALLLSAPTCCYKKGAIVTSLFDYSFEIITKYHVNSCGNISLLSSQSPIGFMRINAVEPKSILFDICFSSKLFSIILIESEPDLYRLEQMAVSCEIYFFALYFNLYKLVCR